MSAVTPIDAGGKQTQDAMDPRVRPESKKWCCKEQEDGQEDSYDDADGLLQTLLLLSTLTLAFAVTLHSGTLGHADFEEADFRWSKHMYYQRLSDGRWDQTKMDGDLLPGLEDGFGGLLSVRARTLGYICVSLSVISLFCGASTYLSLTYSNAREDKKYFKSWFKSFRWVILFGYLTFVGAILFFFFLNHIVVKIQYPLYNDDARFFLNGTVYYPPETTYDPDYTDGPEGNDYYGADMDRSADIANGAIIALVALTFVGIFILDQIVRRELRCAEKNKSDSESTSKTEAVVDPSKHTIDGVGGGFTPVEQLLKTFKEQQKQLQELHEKQLEEFLKAFVRNTTDKMV